MAFVVFVTTYALVLPAITIDEQTAAAEPGLEISYVNEDGSQAEAAAGEILADADAAEDAADEALANETVEEPSPIEETIEEEQVAEPELPPAEEPQQVVQAEPAAENEPTRRESVAVPEDPAAVPQQEARSDAQNAPESYSATPDNTNENENAAVTESVIAGQTENNQPAQTNVEEIPDASPAEGAAAQETPAQDTNAVYANEAEYLAATYPARRFEAKVEETTQRMIIQGTEVDPDAEPVMSLKARELAERAEKAAQTGEEPYTEDILKALYVTVEAQTGAFPKDTFMAIEALRDEDVLQAFKDAAEGEAIFAKVVGITFYDKDSNIINPTVPVRITFQNSAFMEADSNLVFTVTDDDYIIPVNQYDPVANNLAMDEVAFDADKSNFFAVVGTKVAEDTVNTNVTEDKPEEKQEDKQEEEREDKSEEEREDKSEDELKDNLEEDPAEEAAENDELHTIKAEDPTYEITVTYDSKSGIPENAELVVNEIIKGDKDYQYYYNKSTGGEGAHKEARIFDIEIWADGKKIEPENQVCVNIKLKDAPVAEDAESKVVHFGDKGPEEMTLTDDTESVGDGAKVITNTYADEMEVSFETDAFSVYSVVYTVDFTWEVEGKVYDFSIPGGGYVSFSQLAEVLGLAKQEEQLDTQDDTLQEMQEEASKESLTIGDITVSEDTRKFVADVESITFSTPELLSVSKAAENTTVGEIKTGLGLECEYSAELTQKQIDAINAAEVQADDWALISLKPFSSTESLSVTLKTGEAFEIRVTDAQIKRTVLSASGETYEITVTYGEDAQIPDGAELKVREITEADVEYDEVRTDIAENLVDNAERIPAHPVLFDISIWSGNQEIEPAKGSSVQVEIKLVRDSLKGMFSDEDAPLLVNDMPISEEKVGVEQSVQVIHQVEAGRLEIMETMDTISDEEVVSQFQADSFSNWLVYLDEDLPTIEISQGDTITLREFTEWIWHKEEEPDEYKNVTWKMRNQYGQYVDPFSNNIMNFTKYSRTTSEDEIHENYNLFHGRATGLGEITLYRVNSSNQVVGDPIVVRVTNKPQSQKPGVVTENIAANVKVNLFDYNTDAQVPGSINNLDVKYNTASSWDRINNNHYTGGANGDTRDFYQNTPPYERSVNTGSDLKFLGWGSNDSSQSKYAINSYTGTAPKQQIVADDLGDDGFPYLRSSANNNASLGYLFDTTSRSESVYAYPDVGGLFQIDTETGYYYFNSNSNYAEYNNGEIVLYEHTYTQETVKNNQVQPSSKPIGFFPFHEYNSAADLSPNHDTDLNHHFGMSMSVGFALPKDKLNKGEHIIYEFSGDDDLWVYVDGQLALDIGGIHQPVRGYIDFTTGEVYVYGVNGSQPQVVNWIKELTPGKEHTLDMFYLERGGCDSNLSVKFNMPLTVDKADIRVVKEKDKETPEAAEVFLSGAKFGLWDDESCAGEPLRTETSNGSGVVLFKDVPIMEEGQVYYMKEIVAPAGYYLNDTIYKVTAVNDGNGNRSFVISIKDDPDAQIDTTVEAPHSPIIYDREAKPIALTVEKQWVGGTPTDASITFEVKRYKSYDGTITHTTLPCTLNVYRYKNANNSVLVTTRTYSPGTQATVSWGYSAGYYGYNGYGNKPDVYGNYRFDTSGSWQKSNNYSVSVTMSQAGETRNLYLRDENIGQYGDGVVNISVNPNSNSTESTTTEHVFATNEPDDDYHGPTKTLNSTTGWTWEFDEQPAYHVRDDGITEYYTYYIVEQESGLPAGYHVAYDSMTGDKITGSSESETRIIINYKNEVYVEKRWYSADGQLLDPQPTRSVNATLSSTNGGSFTGDATKSVTAGTVTVWEVVDDPTKLYEAEEETLTGYDTTYTYLDAGEETERTSGGVHRGGTIYINNTITTGDLELSKIVTGTGADLNKSFEFEIALTAPSGVTLAESYPAAHTGDNTLTTVTLNEGKITGISLKNGEHITITGIPDGTTYTITETNYEEEGYTAAVTNGSLTGTIVAGEKASTEVTNNYSVVEIGIIKIDEATRNDTTPTRLSGAKFKLHKLTGVTETSTGTYTVYPDAASAEREVASDGTLTFSSLPNGKYMIEETITPPGYVKRQAVEIYFTVENGTVTWTDKYGQNTITAQNLVTYEPAEKTFTVGNEPGAALPSTGGPGTRLFTILGSILILGAGVLLWRRRRLI